jgi:3',5'-cyclic AMP phosphodiesterase CpdA
MLIAQLSDIHLDGAASLERLDGVLRWVAELRPDAVAVSGDLANNSYAANYTLLKGRLEAFGVPVLVVPGNVDSREAMREVFGGPANGPLNRVVQVGDIRLVGLDVIVPGAAHGDATPVLGWLEAELSSGGGPALIFLRQHPFDCGMDQYETIDCRNKEGLAAVIERAADKVLGISCGHLHRPMFARFAGVPATLAPAIARMGGLAADGRKMPATDPPGLLVHHLKGDNLVTHVISVGG